MTKVNLQTLNTALDALPKYYPGPGGVAAVMQGGKVLASRAWGYTNLASSQPMTGGTRLPICSITKQFTCQVLLAEIAYPSRLDARVAEFLPAFTGQLPTLRQLSDNQSGLRDYWALTVLQGAFAEQPFRREDALPLLARMKTGHFAPGTQYSYCNCNFRILSEIIESETGESLATLYDRHIWTPAGMKTTVLTSDTSRPEDGVVGYEGSDSTGYFPAQNGIYWIGDAGISASLYDMMAYEAWIDATRDDANSLYRRASAGPVFGDGTPARYGNGVAHRTMAGLAVTGHGGALRGFRAQRFNAAEARLSVVVMFNHEASAYGAAEGLILAALDQKAPDPVPVPDGWDGQWLGPNNLLTKVESGRSSAMLHYATGAEALTLTANNTLAAPGVELARTAEGMMLKRAGDNSFALLTPLVVVDIADGTEIAGHYQSSELNADLQIEARGGGVYARFKGMLGEGPMERVVPAGKDVWTLATRRSMDAPAPGDWTLIVKRNETGGVSGIELGCWLARGIYYQRN
ncbi:D-aminopeptidase [Pseudorhodobacter sp.]|uniref:D-aminopeptidase n=1 Tax=Pseudorhodobacter sp. TaxID=1934400 RepID=UPI002649D8B8|nr:D-aminopeptidase [Pseudorhodobacter sp.]MDN5786807.1 D-aminopeptidase [Pseudorhodobacter sp.]